MLSTLLYNPHSDKSKAVLIADTPLRATLNTQDEAAEVCELVASVPAENDKEWWICTNQELQDNCREVYVDGDVQVACAF